jgi:Zn-dependent peptidase ImmA (M78 family)
MMRVERNMCTPRKLRLVKRRERREGEENMATNERIEALAQRVWELSGMEHPVNPVNVADSFEISVYQGKLADGVSGGLSRIDNETKIYIKKGDPHVRAKFTIAHELGHYFIHMPAEDDFAVVDYHRDTISARGTDPKEVEANNFAAALLMNKELFLDYWHRYGSIALLAKEFDVSQEAARYRLHNLGVDIHAR